MIHYLAGFLIARVDKLSHQRLADHELQQQTELVTDIFREWGEPWFNHFSTAENAQC